MSPAHKASTGARFVELPAHWTPEQALAVFEVIDMLRDQLWTAYGPEIQRALREDRVTQQQLLPFDPDEPF